MDSCVANLRQALDNANVGASRRAEIEQQLLDIADDVKFLRIGNGIHNIHYASSLTDGIVGKLSELCDVLRIDPPDVKLPARPESIKQGG